MLTAQLKELLRNLRAGKRDESVPAFLEQLSAKDFVAELRRYYPVVFQERQIGRKQELGLARYMGLKNVQRADRPGSTNLPVLLNCLLVNSYSDSLTGLEALSWIRVIPPESADADLTLVASRGFKLDKTPDGWLYRQSGRSRVKFSEQFLAERGWKFDALRPIWPSH